VVLIEPPHLALPALCLIPPLLFLFLVFLFHLSLHCIVSS
jgi:hypothetical protein